MPPEPPATAGSRLDKPRRKLCTLTGGTQRTVQRGVSKYISLLKAVDNESIYLDEPGMAVERLQEWTEKDPKAVFPKLALGHHYSQSKRPV